MNLRLGSHQHPVAGMAAASAGMHRLPEPRRAAPYALASKPQRVRQGDLTVELPETGHVALETQGEEIAVATRRLLAPEASQ
jgi:hypothetical protein